MKFEVGKWYGKNSHPHFKFLCVNVRDEKVHDFVSYWKEEGSPCTTFSVDNEKSASLYYELKEPRVIETKTEWYAAVNFDNPPTQNVLDRICGADIDGFGDSLDRARNEHLCKKYPSLAKIEIAAKVTEIFEDE